MNTKEALAKMKGEAKLTQAEALAKMKAEAPPEAPEAHWSNLLPEGGVRDVLRALDKYPMAAAQGLFHSITEAPGLPGTVQQALQLPKRETDLGNLMKALPQNPVTMESIREATDAVVPTQKYTGGPKLIETAAEYAFPTPGAPAKWGAATFKAGERGAKEALTALTSASGSEGAGYLADKLKLGDTAKAWAEFFGSLAGVRTARGKKPNAVKIAGEGAPDADTLKTMVDDANLKNKTTVLRKSGFSDALDYIKDEGVKPRMIPGLLGDLETLNKKSAPLTYGDLQHLDAEARRHSRAYSKENPNLSFAGRVISEKLDDFLENAAPQNPALKQEIKEARELGRSQAKSRDLRAAQERGAASSQSGKAIGAMNEVRALFKRQFPSFSPLEKEAITNIVGRNANHPLRRMGRGAQGFLFQAAGAGASAGTQSITPSLLATGAGALGRAAEWWIDSRTMKKLSDLEAMFRAGRPAQEKAMAEAKRLTGIRNETTIRGILQAVRQQGMAEGN